MLARENDFSLHLKMFGVRNPIPLLLANGLVGRHARKGKYCVNTNTTCTMSIAYPVVIKHCLLPSAQTKACDMFINQQGSHYCTQQPPCHNAHT